MPTIDTSFVPANLDATNWDNIEPLARALLDRPVASGEAYERWLLDRSEFEAACQESAGILYINMTCDTGDEEAERAYTRYIQTIPPRLKPLVFELDRRQVELARRFPRRDDRHLVLDRDTAAAVELFRPENVPIETELDELAQKYQKITGAMTVHYQGEERPLPQMARFMLSTDRAERESSWRAVAERRMRDADAISDVYDRMVRLRHQTARNAGFPGYVEYAFRQKRRFDYTAEDCRRFHDACAAVVVPFNARRQAERQQAMGLSALRPWDVAVDPLGRPPLRPFEGGVDLVRKTRTSMERLDRRLATMLETLGDGSNTRGARSGESLDLDSRKGKAPGGYQAMLDRRRVPFIFMNAAGLHRDVETMAHEAGHAFHSMLCAEEPLLHYRNPPIEFAEVASMSMELLTMPHWKGEGSFYTDEAEYARAVREHLEASVGTLAWIATIDAFQHWVYAQPEHSRAQRAQHWLALEQRFGFMGRFRVDWGGIDAAIREHWWQRQLHPFGVPMYYIEYGIAQLGALQLWLMALERGESTAVEHYIKSMTLGGSKPLPELFKAAGIRFDFGPDTLKRLVDRAEAELQKVPL